MQFLYLCCLRKDRKFMPYLKMLICLICVWILSIVHDIYSCMLGSVAILCLFVKCRSVSLFNMTDKFSICFNIDVVIKNTKYYVFTV